MNAQHTPGPWLINGPTSSRPLIYSSQGMSDNIADICDSESGEHIANARLIAAAPEMIAEIGEAIPLLETTLNSLNIWGHGQTIPAQVLARRIAGLRAVHAKATGDNS